ncbi:MAG: phytanoyl-CoA dioxygenase family protein [Pseudomonadota bacterium]
MTQQLQHFQLTDDWAEIIRAIDEDGGVIVERFLDPKLHTELVEQLKPHADGFEPGMAEGSLKALFCGQNTKRFSALCRRAPVFAEVVDHDLLHEWAEHGFQNDYWLNTGQAMIIGPGSTEQFLHRDAGNWPVVVAGGQDAPEATLSVMIAMSDFTVDNGATRVVPGSHRWSDFDQEATPDQVVQAVMPAGSALLYSGKTIHGAGANISSDSWRFGIQLSFTLGQLTPEEAHTITVPWTVAQHFSERVQHMLGYASLRTFSPDWPVLWTADYRDVRESLTPPPKHEYVSAGAKHLKLPVEAA